MLLRGIRHIIEHKNEDDIDNLRIQWTIDIGQVGTGNYQYVYG